MPFEFKLPDLGEGIREAQLLAWKVQPGQDVRAFDPLCEVESAKAAVELTSPVPGRVRETRAAEGQTVHLGEVLVVIDTDAAPSASGAAAAGNDDEWFGIVGTAPAAQKAARPGTGAAQRIFAAPFVRKLARDLHVELENVSGSGPQGRIRAADVEAFAASARAGVARDVLSKEVGESARATPVPGISEAAAPALEPSAREEVVPLSGLRAAIASHMVEAARVPQVTSMDLFDLTELVRARDILQQSAPATKLSYLPFFIKASIAGLRAVPDANALFDDFAKAIRRKKDYHIGVATAVSGGLVVPVIRNADRLTVLEIAQELDRLIRAARERRIAPGELVGGTFSITSFGGLPGSPLFATPILNSPQTAILGVGRIDLQPRVVDGQVVPRHCAGMSFTFDHRVLDGEGAGQFMAVLKRILEQPLELLLTLR